MNPESDNSHLITEEEQDVLDSISINKIILPVGIGVIVVLVLMWYQFDLEMLSKITWSRAATLWVIAACVVICLRHFAYMARLRIMTDGAFSWRKCFELIFIWEFSSAVTPTSVGGSAVAMFVLAQEKLPAGKIATIIFYTIIFDTFFFILGLPALLLIHGKFLITPGGEGGFLIWLCDFKWLRRFKDQAHQLTEDMVLTAKEIKQKPISYHLGGFLTTAAAWSFRFITVMCLPGGSGIAESAFGPFLNDFIPIAGIALIIALLWRVLTYYSYLIAGAIIIPNWIRGVLNRRKKKNVSSRDAPV